MSQKVTKYMIPCIRNIQNRHIQRGKVDLWLPGTGGRGGELAAKGHRVCFWGEENVIKLW